jgi:hypothetical protein
MGIPSYTALVHFPDDTARVVVVFEPPVQGGEISTLKGWVVDDVKLREQVFEGQEVHFEVWLELKA